MIIPHGSIFICYGLHSSNWESTDFTNLNDLIPKASFSIFRFIFGNSERSDGIFHQKLCIWKWIQMWNSHFGSIFRLWNWFVNLGLKMAKQLLHGHDFWLSETKLGRILTNCLKIGPIMSNLHRYMPKILLVCYPGHYFFSTLYCAWFWMQTSWRWST